MNNDYDEILQVAKELRECLRFDEPCIDESQLESKARQAADMLQHVHGYLKSVDAWQKEGAEILNIANKSFLFKFGDFWGSRPWKRYT